MEKWEGRVALVTGASVGIGVVIAEKLTVHGMTVIGCARNTGKIQELSEALKARHVKGHLVPFKCDVSDETQILRMFSDIKEKYGGVDVCINNAGLAYNQSLLSGETEKWKHMLMVNVIGLCTCTREAVKSMRERNVDDGYIINMNSLAGHDVPNSNGFHFYAATKHAVKALTIGVRNELRRMKSNIRISALSPGEVKTEFAYRMNLGNQQAIDTYFKKNKTLVSEDVADIVVFALSSPPHAEVQDLLVRGKM